MEKNIEILDNEDLVFFLDEIGLSKSFLIIEEDSKYFETPVGYFYFNSLQDFIYEDRNMKLINEDQESFLITHEQFETIKEILLEVI